MVLKPWDKESQKCVTVPRPYKDHFRVGKVGPYWGGPYRDGRLYDFLLHGKDRRAVIGHFQVVTHFCVHASLSHGKVMP